ncbi:MAG: hypothetical protein LBE92_17380 [Chryseobacterium sp.]|jgi:hypothetical protein|uniref:hypothetical protein n=1 Tax=Chryseobacterium sp. TaxID=1871047 RepID=UPI002822188A|nr:hypothetical protein [Chryseobacterium sp.]MDR2237899.1 hypothetical protein [Chryseobacterium sp.]
MYEWNYFYGAIMLNSDYQGFLDFIQHKMKDKGYHYFHPSIFSQAIQEYPYYYDNILISFGRTAKWFLDDERELKEFIREFEDILSHLDFQSIQIKVGGVYNDFSFFWLNKKRLLSEPGSGYEITMKYVHENKIRLYESEDFYFGLGEINMSTGWCEKSSDPDDLASFDRQYPDFKYPVEQINR